MNRRTLWISIGVLLMVTTCCTCGGLSALGIWSGSRLPKGVEIQAAAPDTAVLDEPFTVHFSVHNMSNRSHTLHSIGLDEALRENFTVLEVSPAPTEMDEFAGMVTYALHAPLPPQNETQVTLTLVAKKPGLHIGTVEVCIDSTTRCKTFQLAITARE